MITSEEALTFKTEADKLINEIGLTFYDEILALTKKYGDIAISIELPDDLK
jgi:beta-glucosidase/6-phospho-beta-glucosidase/beta-galactosidase